MWILYDIVVIFAQGAIRLAAFFNRKMAKWVQGQKGLLKKVERTLDPGIRYSWFHFASLGEFEQGRTVLEAYRKKHPSKKIVVTFFSPSGYEVRANYAQADHVFYLPLDTYRNAKRWVALLNPEIAFFVKYEFWPNYFRALSENKTPLFLISGIFRKEQIFFKSYGSFFRKVLQLVDHFFVQNQESVDLLTQIGIRQVSLTGDTRFDRVAHLAEQPRGLTSVEHFIGERPVLVAGSTWSPDEALLENWHFTYPDWCLIIAPHEIHEAHLMELKARFTDSLLYSALQEIPKDAADPLPSVLIIDNMGLLSSLYAYADVAYIGGGFGVGIHNTLEAAAYRIPVVFGPAYEKFKEAKDLIALKAAFSVANRKDLQDVFEKFQTVSFRKAAGLTAFQYVQQQAGATEKIMDYLL